MRDDEELILLVDADDRIIGTGEKLETHRRGALHRAFSVIVWNSAGRLLLKKRAAGKISLRRTLDQCLLWPSAPKRERQNRGVPPA
jgi:isopentenyldiphosphate isomerase